MGNPEDKRLGAIPSLTGTIARLAYAQAKAAGIDVGLLIKKTNLTREQIEDPDVRIGVRDQTRFLNLAADALKDDMLGFHLAQRADLRELGLLYYVAASSSTLGEALQRGARCSAIINEGISLKYFDDRGVVISFDDVGVSRHLDWHHIEFFVTILVRICRQLTGSGLAPTRVRLIHRRDSTDPEFLEFFKRDIEFGAAVDEIAFAAAVEHLPVVSADPYLHKVLMTYCDEALWHRPANMGSFRSVVENAIVALLPHGQARAAEIVRRLGVSPRTFVRRLSLEGVSFSEVLKRLRFDLAKRYLRDESLSISQIAWLLGYQEVSSFTHAFKRWTGKTPRKARSRDAS